MTATPSPAPKSKDSDKKKSPKTATEQAASDLADLIAHNRKVVRLIADHLAANMEAAYLQVLKDARALEPASRRRAFCKRAVKRIEGLKVKSGKGRLRDLRRVDELLSELSRDLNEIR
jgi:hypothetical protein